MRNFSEEKRRILLDLIDGAIEYGLENHKPLSIELSQYPDYLQQIRASFVTLRIHGLLRGCIGTLKAHLPLIVDIAMNTYAAAFKDPRFPKVTRNEYPLLTKSISVLSVPEPLDFTSEEDLITRLRPNIDGLILIEGEERGTFLPSVWESLKTPREFLDHLKIKSGLPADYWSDTIKIKRYTTEVIE